jgi:hypothetical protein
MIKKKKYLENKEYILLKNNIDLLSDKVFLPKYNDSILKNNNNKSWFNISIYKDEKNIKIPTIKENIIKIDNNLENKKSEKIILRLNNEQKEILNSWFKSNDLMYNETIKFIKNNYSLYELNKYNIANIE